MTAQEWSKFPVEPYINLNPDKAGPTAEYLVEQCRKKDAEIERLWKVLSHLDSIIDKLSKSNV